MVLGDDAEAAAQPFAMGGEQRTVGLSVGIAIFPEDGQDAARLVQRADAAMYSAKRAGAGFALADRPLAPARR